MFKSTASLLAVVLVFTVSGHGASQLVISEFMAANQNSISDNDGDKSDWIEIFNGGTNAVSLLGWYLTDTTNNYRKWPFPAVSLAPNGYLLVFASEKDRRNPEAPLHTNFRLSNDGEYLGLVQPDGTNVALEFYPRFPLQATDVSYGFASDARDAVLVNTGTLARALVPTNELGLAWTEASYGDQTWPSGSTGVGYDRNLTGVDYNPLLGLNVEARMFNINQTVYIRIPFLVTNVAEVDTLTLRIQYDDGMIAYLNGREIARDNAPGSPVFDSGAPANRPDGDAVTPRDFDATSSRDFLFVGQNVLAIHGLNNGVGSSDLLARPQLLARTRPTGATALRYFPVPTPGAENNEGVAVLGPIVTEAQHSPNVPEDGQDVIVSARIRQAFAPVSSTVLRYRVMFGAEVELPFVDDGLNGDGAAGDGVYGAIIPASVATPGQMIRWFIRATDTSNVVTRVPSFAEPLRSPEYFGTIVATPKTNNLEILHWFVQNPSAAETVSGTRASMCFLGEFYDNVGVNRHGQSSAGFPKKSFDVDFHRGSNFRWAPGERRVDDINLLTTYPDKAKVRNMLAYEAFRDAGVPYHFVLPVRVHQNNTFWGDTHIVENGDDNYLQRLGLDRNGALYKMYNTLTNMPIGEKKTRKFEGMADLQALYNGAVLPLGPVRSAFMFDNLNVPECINYLAAQTISGNVDCCHKNYYLYRDTEGSGEWQILPWDIDLSYGRVWSSPTTYWDDFLYSETGTRVGNNNTLITAIYNTPELLQMYQRRLRTLMEQLVQPPGTPAAQGRFEQRIEELVALIAPDAALDLAKWGTWCCSSAGPYTQANIPNQASYQTLRQAADYMITNYFPARRTFLFNHSEPAPAMPTNPAIYLTAIEYAPSSGNQLQEYIELRNSNAFAVDISGWQLTGGVDFTFAPGTVMPMNSALYVSPDVRAFRSRTSGPRGGMGLFVQGPYQGQLSARGETVNVVDRFGRTVGSRVYLGNPSLAQRFLRVTELMYRPSPIPGNPSSPEEFEYVELRNIGPVGLNLTGVRLTNGVTFDFTGSAVTNLGPGERVLVMKNMGAFVSRYGASLPMAGQYTGSLDNSGERFRLLDSVGEEVLDFTYNNSWYPITDGLGFSLVIVDEQAHPDDWNRKENWRPSGNLLGSPGAADPAAPVFAPVLINEALTRTLAANDAIELYNPNTNDVDISGWYLTDDFETPVKYRIQNGTVIAAGGYRVFTEAQFNFNPAVPSSFALSSDGDEVYLFGAQTNGQLSGYVHGFEFGAAEEEVSFGRHVSSDGNEHFVAQSAVTLNGTNAGPKVGPVVISEINYHPPDLGTNDNSIDEFIELQNTSASTVPLFDVMRPTNTWRITGGVDFTFPTNVSLNANESILVVTFAPTNASALAGFRAQYNIGAGVRVFGPYEGRLNNDADGINLRTPTPSITNSSGGAPMVSIPYALVEGVEYGDRTPWPKAADVLGYSLQRWDGNGFANDPANWIATPPTAGGGTAMTGTRPEITQEPVGGIWLIGQTRALVAAASGSGPLALQWRLNGTNLPGATDAMLEVMNVQPHDGGDYEFVASNPVATVFSRVARIVVRFPVMILQAPQTMEARVQPDPAAAAMTNVTFTVQAHSTMPIAYQWRRNGSDIAGATNESYTVVDVGTNDLASFSVVARDDISSAESAPVWLYPLVSPVYVEQPVSQSAVAGSLVTLSAQVSGWPPPFTFEWRLGGATLHSNVQNGFVSFFTVNAPASGTVSYRAIVRNRAFPSGRASAFGAITALADSDADGISDQWENAYGLNPGDGMDRNGDADADGMLNWEEFQAGTDPTNALSVLKLDSLVWSNSVLRMQFEAMSNKTYAVEFNTALASNNWQALSGVAARRTNRVEQVIDASPNTNRFYRLITPPSP